MTRREWGQLSHGLSSTRDAPCRNLPTPASTARAPVAAPSTRAAPRLTPFVTVPKSRTVTGSGTAEMTEVSGHAAGCRQDSAPVWRGRWPRPGPATGSR